MNQAVMSLQVTLILLLVVEVLLVLILRRDPPPGWCTHREDPGRGSNRRPRPFFITAAGRPTPSRPFLLRRKQAMGTNYAIASRNGIKNHPATEGGRYSGPPSGGCM